jgi:hypothetical protein
MADFRAKTVGPRVQLAADHEPAADAGAERYQEECLMLLAVTVELLGQRSGRSAVLHRIGQFKRRDTSSAMRTPSNPRVFGKRQQRPSVFTSPGMAMPTASGFELSELTTRAIVSKISGGPARGGASADADCRTRP